MIRICERCGTEFAEKHFAKYCQTCRPAAHREQNRMQHTLIRKRVDEAQGKPVKTLDDWAREARECNLDYGTYRALIAAGKTFEQLKACRRSSQTHSHCRIHKTI